MKKFFQHHDETAFLLRTEREAHLATLNLLHRIKRGEVSLDDVSLEGNRWAVRQPTAAAPSLRPVREG